jgi:CheY-specific phosphatase CheX
VGTAIASKSCFHEVLDTVLHRSTEELFGKTGVARSVASVDSARQVDDLHVGAVISLDGPRIRGALMLITTFGVAARTRPSRLGAAGQLSGGTARDWILVRDWTGELANQLAGRVKNRLHVFGITFQIAPPVSLSGRGLALALQKPQWGRTLAFGSGDGCVRILFDLAAEPQLTTPSPRAGAEEAAREGDIIEF